MFSRKSAKLRKLSAAVILSVVTAASLTACGDSKTVSTTATQNANNAQSTQAGAQSQVGQNTQAAQEAAAGVNNNAANTTAGNQAANNASGNTTAQNNTANNTADNTTNNTAQTNNGSTTGTTSKGYKIETIDGVTYVDGVMIANKTYGLPESYGPGDIVDEVKAAFNVMQQAAAKQGLNIYISSGFRSYSRQATIYNNYVNKDGKAKADTYSARPGHSEHQTGWCFDLNTIDDSFALTPESAWLEQHAQEYGFIIRYPKGKESITGYQYESWHLRYLGQDLATKVFNSGLTLEEYYGITSQYAD